MKINSDIDIFIYFFIFTRFKLFEIIVMVMQIEKLEHEVAELRQALNDKTEQETAVLKV